MKKTIILASLSLLGFTQAPVAQAVVAPAPLVSIPTHDNYFNLLKKHCGKAYPGHVTVDNSDSDAFANKLLVMHVRKCSDNQLQIPFHVGDDASRTWILTKTGSGISLKHDHRKPDGSNDKSTMYGGHTVDAGWDNVQSFPADQYSKELFVNSGIPQSTGNTWQMFIYPKQFTYRLIRQGREFRVDFDLTKPIMPPAAPWGYQD
ncbi:hypothetical protein [Psychrobium sp. 1_MG-2023]|uniref:hypothetical protein n=1 Tax=Psychrobium sp. 1_MG-2023 TaxID=3062624 RepID=UPI000C337194|nr:hypothetical protein [Psychrobium sp. 1_MG-2023]MDP2561081.1 hypothetical protein [Psychrobium sp. 1_MG-2023]PKF58370.1 hypothetical protein CW748_04205 [Alteromonadales bacterium alter-6D02]